MVNPSDVSPEILSESMALVVKTPQAERLDRWLANQLLNYSRSRIQKLIEAGEITINGQVCTQKKTVVQLG
ncbi:MAG: S4 domain-containing protein, partial [Cyanobacteria bacterium J06642_9]